VAREARFSGPDEVALRVTSQAVNVAARKVDITAPGGIGTMANPVEMESKWTSPLCVV
jgi:hypothetical protein